MNNEVLIKAETVSKKFCRNFKRSLWYGMKDIVRSLLGQDHSQDDLRKDEFWAVKDINFEVRRGECLGLIGHNGAGKSTLLKMLNGLINPDQGKIIMRGRIGALIELGAGFNPLLTGKENIYNNGAVLGFTRKEINEKLDAIIEFSEIGEFIDAPVQNYSSGMKVRLGFAVAAQMEPDILLIDEVLAVGDLGFTVKCINRIQQLLKKTAVIFVSHSMPYVSTISTNILLLDKGIVHFIGHNIGEGIEKYLNKFKTNGQQIIATSNTKLIQTSFSSKSCPAESTNNFIITGEPIHLTFLLKIDELSEHIRIRLGFFNIEYRLIAEVDTEQQEFFYSKRADGTILIRVAIMNLNLRYGKYSIHLHVIDKDKDKILLRQSDAIKFNVKYTHNVTSDFILPCKWE